MMMIWRLILEDFEPSIQHIAGIYNIVADTISRFPNTSVDNYEPIIIEDQCCANKLFSIFKEENSEVCFPPNVLNVKI